MLTVTLKPTIAEKAKRFIERSHESLDMLVDKALSAYLDEADREKIRAERRVFDAQREELLAKYRGEYIAVHEGKVMDHDPHLGTLHRRVFARLGDTAVLLKKVTDEPDRELVFRSPRLERIKP